MVDTSPNDVLTLGRDLARSVVGADAVEQVEVTEGEDSSDRPVYFYSFLIDKERNQQALGLVLIRLTQALRDALAARGDEHYPIIRLFDEVDWDKRVRA